MKQRVAAMVNGLCADDPRSAGERRSDAVGAIADKNDVLEDLILLAEVFYSIAVMDLEKGPPIRGGGSGFFGFRLPSQRGGRGEHGEHQ